MLVADILWNGKKPCVCRNISSIKHSMECVMIVFLLLYYYCNGVLLEPFGCEHAVIACGCRMMSTFFLPPRHTRDSNNPWMTILLLVPSRFKKVQRGITQQLSRAGTWNISVNLDFNGYSWIASRATPRPRPGCNQSAAIKRPPTQPIFSTAPPKGMPSKYSTVAFALLYHVHVGENPFECMCFLHLLFATSIASFLS